MSTFKTKFAQLRTWLAYLKELCFGPYFDPSLRPDSERKKFRFQGLVMAGLYGGIVFTLSEAAIALLLGRTSAMFSVAALFVCWTLWRMRMPGLVTMTAWVHPGSDKEIGYQAYALRPFLAAWRLISLYVNLFLVTLSFMVLFGGYRPARGQSWRDTVLEMHPYVLQITMFMIIVLITLRVIQLGVQAVRMSVLSPIEPRS